MRRIALLLAALVATSAFAAPLVAAPKGTEHYNKSGEREVAGSDECGDGNRLAIVAPEALWPPNHKYYEPIHAIATDEDGDSIVLTTTGTHDQYEEDGELNGSGNTGDDITLADDEALEGGARFGEQDEDSDSFTIVAVEDDEGQVQTDWKARAERSGRDQTGRVYTFTAHADFTDGDCGLDVTFKVPHDMRPSNR